MREQNHRARLVAARHRASDVLAVTVAEVVCARVVDACQVEALSELDAFVA